jgi:3,4-dihydroxy 2-butanone 4-phosphate synthase/GTP cyclohydrolase II
LAAPAAPGARRPLDPIEDIVAATKAGQIVILMDDEDRENEGDLIMAAEKVTPEAIAFFVRHTSGIICAPMTRERLEQLRLPQMVPDNTEAHRTAFTVSVDYKHGTTTGISAHDRAKTIRALADPASKPEDFARPGHIFPLRCAEGGVLTRAGHTEASVDLARMAGLSHAAIICEVVNDDGTMKRGPELIAFAREHKLKIGTIADLIRYRFSTEHSVERIADRPISTEFGDFRLVVYEDRIDKTVHLALVHGEVHAHQPTLVRVHIRNTLQDVLGARHEQFGWPLRRALERIAQEDSGIVVLLRKPESPRELVQQIMGLDPSPAGVPLVSAEDSVSEEDRRVLRTYGIGAQILSDLGVRKMRVLSAPLRMQAISGFGLEVVEYVSRD